MSSSHCILPQLYLPYLLRKLLHLEISCQSPPMQRNTLATSCSFSPAAAVTTTEQTSFQGGHLQGSMCTEVATALLVTAGARVMSCSKSSPFGCCLLMQTAHLALSCVKCQVNHLAYLHIPLAALLGALPEGARAVRNAKCIHSALCKISHLAENLLHCL